uniref:Uncharacterized protein n=1 Tax=Daphnia magna TaxID=35525 RepID=A0A0P4YG42_9CRUS
MEIIYCLQLKSYGLIDLEALSVEGNVDWGNGEFVFVDGSDGENVFMDRGNWEFVNMDGSNGQVVTFGLESSVISGPGQSEFLAFRGNPVRRSLVGVAKDFRSVFLAVVIDGSDGKFLLLLGFLTGGVVRLGVVPLSAAINVTLIGLAGDGDLRVFVVLLVRLFVRFVAGRSGGSNGQDSSDNKQLHVEFSYPAN